MAPDRRAAPTAAQICSRIAGPLLLLAGIGLQIQAIFVIACRNPDPGNLCVPVTMAVGWIGAGLGTAGSWLDAPRGLACLMTCVLLNLASALTIAPTQLQMLARATVEIWR